MTSDAQTAEREAVGAELDAILAPARRRFAEASDTMRGLHPAEVDWMTPEEAAEYNDALLRLPRSGLLMAEAAERVANKRAARVALAKQQEDEMTNIYLVIYHDRHQDDIYVPCVSAALAESETQRLMEVGTASYGLPPKWTPTEISDWLFCYESGDDGPHVHTEKLKMKKA